MTDAKSGAIKAASPALRPHTEGDQIKTIPHRIAALNREVDRLADENRDLRAKLAHIDALEAERAKGTRWFVPAYRAANGWVGPVGTETVEQEYAENEAVHLRRHDDEAEIFVATRVIPPWTPVQEDDR